MSHSAESLFDPAHAGATYQGGERVAEVTRSGVVESVHLGSVAVVGRDGTVLASTGDTTTPIFPRSALKPVFAVGLLKAGWAPDSDADVALAAASHCGDAEHVTRVMSVLQGAGLTESALQCPADLPYGTSARESLLAGGGTASARFMTCSGKHAAMLATCVANGWDVGTYRDPDHPLQLWLSGTVARMTGDREPRAGMDGCGVPTFAVSLRGLARAAASLVDAEEGTPERRVADAIRAHPHLVGGEDRSDTHVMESVPGLLAKFGAEGVQLLAFPDRGAVAVKIDDGAIRAALPVAIGAFTAGVGLPVGEGREETFDELRLPPVWGGGVKVGTVRPA